VQSRHHAGFYSSYSFKIIEAGNIVISVSQWDSRLFPADNRHPYFPLRVILERKKGGAGEYVTGGTLSLTQAIHTTSETWISNSS
jgi:hypothetical protein